MKYLCLALMFAFAAPVCAADLTVNVTLPTGAGVEHAVVTFVPSGGAALRPADLKGTFVMAQKGLKFAPHVLVVPKGATVQFPNLDRVNHHVFSFSPANRFQLPLYGKGVTKTMTFANAGTAALGCNIHDAMRAYIRVVDTPFYAVTAVNGATVLKGVPEGAGTLTIWHPRLAAANNEMTQTVTPGKAPKPVSVSIRLRDQ